MKLFLYMAAFIMVALTLGIVQAIGEAIPLRLGIEGAIIVALVPLLVLAWWLSRPKVEKHEPVEKPE